MEVSKMKYKCPHCEKIVEGLETPFKTNYEAEGNKETLVLIECPECHKRFVRRDVWSYKGTAIGIDIDAIKAMEVAPYVEPEEPKKMVKVKKYRCTDNDDLFDDLDALEEMVFGNVDDDDVREYIDEQFDRVEIGPYLWSASEVIDNMGDFDDFREDEDFKDWFRENKTDNYIGNDDVNEMVVGTTFTFGGYEFEVVEVEEEEE